MSEVPKWLRLQEKIDYLYFCLGKLYEEMPKTAIEKMVDEACGNLWYVTEAQDIAGRLKALKQEFAEVTGESVTTEMEDAILSLPVSEADEQRRRP